jgi:peptidoglycan/xylan/chitin deacetylase (PgdA/CDA1 family)
MHPDHGESSDGALFLQQMALPDSLPGPLPTRLATLAPGVPASSSEILPVALGTAAVLAAAAALSAWACLSDGSQLCGKNLVAPPDPGQVALTFDDGPNPAVTPHLLDLLSRHNVRATFFLIGTHVQHEPALTRRIAAAGHRIGNHTMNHPWLPRHNSRTIRAELAACNDVLEQILGEPVTLFRAPHGARRPAVLRIARSLGLATVQWNLIVGDWKPIPADEILRRIQRGIERNGRPGFGQLQGAGTGTNVVLHDGGQHTLSAERMPTVQAVRQLLELSPPGTTFVQPPDWR